MLHSFDPLMTYLQRLEGVREGLHPDQERGHDDGGGVVGAVVAPCSQVPCKAAPVLNWPQTDASARKLRDESTSEYLRPQCSQLLRISPWTSASFAPSGLPSAWTGRGKCRGWTGPGSDREDQSDKIRAADICHPHGLSGRSGSAQVTYLWLVVGENPWKDRILHQVIVRPTSQRIEVHQVLKVTDFPFLVERQETQETKTKRALE